MAAPSNYRTEAVDIGANTYSKPVQTGIGQVLGGLFEMAGQAEQKRALGVEQQEVEQARSEFFGEMTQAQKDYADITSAKMSGQEYTPEQQAVLNKYGSETAILQAAVEQGALKYHQFRTRQEGLLRDFKRDRPDLAAEADKMYAGALGFDVRGAAMDYYNFLLDKTESKVAMAAKQAKAAGDAFKDQISTVKELVKLQPFDLQNPLQEQVIQIESNVARGLIPVTAGAEMLNGIISTYATTSSTAVVNARKQIDSTFTEVLNQSASLLNAANAGQLRVGPDGKLDSEAIANVTKMKQSIFGIYDNAGRIESTSPQAKGYAEAAKKKADYLIEQIEEVEKKGTIEALLAMAKNEQEYALLNLDATQEATARDVAKLLFNTEPERAAWVKSIAPAITAGDAIAKQMTPASGGTPWTARYPSGIADKLSGVVVNKLFNHLSGTDSAEIGKVVPILTSSLVSYGAQRVDGNGRVVARSPDQLFGSSGSLYAFTSPAFAKEDIAKSILKLPKQERIKVAYGIAMNLDRYNEYVVAAANKNDSQIANRPIRISQVLADVESGKLPVNSAYEVAIPSVDKAALKPFNLYEDEAIRTWNFVRMLVQ